MNNSIIEKPIKVNYCIKSHQVVFDKVQADNFDKLCKVQATTNLDYITNHVKHDGMEVLKAVKGTLLGTKYAQADNFLILTNKRCFMVSLKYKLVHHQYGSFKHYPVSLRDFCNNYRIVIDDLKASKYHFKGYDFKYYYTFPVSWEAMNKKNK